MSGVTVSRIGGRVVAVHEAEPDTPEADRILRVAEVLGRVRHPGVVELVDLQATPTVRMSTVFVSTESWADRPPEGAAAVTGLAQVCSIIADLHDAGIAHGSLETRHVLVCADGRPVLCGFEASGSADTESVAVDLESLACIAEELASGSGSEVGSALTSVATDLRKGKLTARTCTTRLDGLRQHRSGESRWRNRIDRRVSALLGTGIAVVLILTATTFACGNGSASFEPDITAGPADLEPQTPETTLPNASSVSVPKNAPTGPDTGALPAAGFAAELPLNLGMPEVEHDGRRYGVGRPGDVVVLGDWTCDGVRTPAALRPSTGEIAIFTTWPIQGEALLPARIDVIEAAYRLEVDGSASCEQLRVHTPIGSQLLTLENS